MHQIDELERKVAPGVSAYLPFIPKYKKSKQQTKQKPK